MLVLQILLREFNVVIPIVSRAHSARTVRVRLFKSLHKIAGKVTEHKTHRLSAPGGLTKGLRERQG